MGERPAAAAGDWTLVRRWLGVGGGHYYDTANECFIAENTCRLVPVRIPRVPTDGATSTLTISGIITNGRLPSGRPSDPGAHSDGSAVFDECASHRYEAGELAGHGASATEGLQREPVGESVPLADGDSGRADVDPDCDVPDAGARPVVREAMNAEDVEP